MRRRPVTLGAVVGLPELDDKADNQPDAYSPVLLDGLPLSRHGSGASHLNRNSSEASNASSTGDLYELRVEEHQAIDPAKKLDIPPLPLVQVEEALAAHVIRLDGKKSNSLRVKLALAAKQVRVKQPLDEAQVAMVANNASHFLEGLHLWLPRWMSTQGQDLSAVSLLNWSLTRLDKQISPIIYIYLALFGYVVSLKTNDHSEATKSFRQYVHSQFTGFAFLLPRVYDAEKFTVLLPKIEAVLLAVVPDAQRILLSTLIEAGVDCFAQGLLAVKNVLEILPPKPQLSQHAKRGRTIFTTCSHLVDSPTASAESAQNNSGRCIIL